MATSADLSRSAGCSRPRSANYDADLRTALAAWKAGQPPRCGSIQPWAAHQVAALKPLKLSCMTVPLDLSVQLSIWGTTSNKPYSMFCAAVSTSVGLSSKALRRLCQFLQQRARRGCNSGTDALILALRGLGIGPGDGHHRLLHFLPPEAISAVGAKPVFVDVDPSTYLINLEQMEAAITPATKALLPVHLFGRPVDMEALTAIARRHSCW